MSLKQKSKEKVCINQQVKNLEPGKFSINVPWFVELIMYLSVHCTAHPVYHMIYFVCNIKSPFQISLCYTCLISPMFAIPETSVKCA